MYTERSDIATFVIAALILLHHRLVVSVCGAHQLSADEFDRLLDARNAHLFVYFHTESCDECAKLLFTWQLLERRIAASFGAELLIGEIRCDSHKSLCARERIDPFRPVVRLYVAPLDRSPMYSVTFREPVYDLPTFEAFLRKSIPRSVLDIRQNENIYTPEADHDHGHDEVENKRSTAMIGGNGDAVDPENVLSKLPATRHKLSHWVLKGFYELSDEDFSLFLSVKGENLIYFYTPWCKMCRILEPKWDIIIRSFELRLTRLSRINCARNPYACKHYLVDDCPVVMWISNGHVKQQYKNLQQDFIGKMRHLIGVIEDPAQHDKLQLNLNMEDFRLRINAGNYFVHFTVPWSRHCQRMTSEWTELLHKIAQRRVGGGGKFPVQIGTVDCSVNEILCDIEQVDGYPTIYLYQNGNRLPEYDGKRTAESFLNYLKPYVLSESSKDEL